MSIMSRKDTVLFLLLNASLLNFRYISSINSGVFLKFSSTLLLFILMIIFFWQAKSINIFSFSLIIDVQTVLFHYSFSKAICFEKHISHSRITHLQKDWYRNFLFFLTVSWISIYKLWTCFPFCSSLQLIWRMCKAFSYQTNYRYVKRNLISVLLLPVMFAQTERLST